MLGFFDVGFIDYDGVVGIDGGVWYFVVFDVC